MVKQGDTIRLGGDLDFLMFAIFLLSGHNDLTEPFPQFSFSLSEKLSLGEVSLGD